MCCLECLLQAVGKQLDEFGLRGFLRLSLGRNSACLGGSNSASWQTPQCSRTALFCACTEDLCDQLELETVGWG